MVDILDPILTVASGAVGDRVYARNQHGPYSRARTIPVDTASPRKDRVRTRFADIAGLWGSLLTPAQRDGWTTYGADLELRSRSARREHLTPQQLFMRSNLPRQIIALQVIADAPVIFRRPVTGAVGVSTPIGLGLLTIAFDNTQEWANDNLGALVVFSGPMVSAGTNFFAGPYRRAGIIRGNVASPPMSPRVVFDPFGVQPGSRKYFRCYVVTGDGRVSHAARGEVT